MFCAGCMCVCGGGVFYQRARTCAASVPMLKKRLCFEGFHFGHLLPQPRYVLHMITPDDHMPAFNGYARPPSACSERKSHMHIRSLPRCSEDGCCITWFMCERFVCERRHRAWLPLDTCLTRSVSAAARQCVCMATNGARRQAKVRLRVVPRGEQVAVKHALAPARDPQGSDHHHHRHHRPRKPSREAIKVNRVVARKSVESEEPDRQRGSSNGGAKGGEGVPQRAASNCGTKGGKPDRQRAASNGGAKGGEPDSQRAASNGDAKGGEDGNSRHDGDHRFQSQNSMSRYRVHNTARVPPLLPCSTFLNFRNSRIRAPFFSKK